MKILQINTTCGRGSTGKIAVGISRLLCREGAESRILYCTGQSDEPESVLCSSPRYVKTQALRARLLGNWGFNSAAPTKRMIAEIERFEPDIVHLHNIHGHDCDLARLFTYFREHRTRLVWTFHDCWAFTGYCPHFTMAGCDAWLRGCGECPQKREFSWLLDRSHTLLERKKTLFCGQDLTVVTPSHWLAELTERSILAGTPTRVIPNGIDLSIFRPTKSDFRERHGLADKRILLAVAFGWGVRKGLDILLDIARRLPPDCQLVLVGTTDAIDRTLPDHVLSIHRTQDQHELAAIYSAADVLLNPTREENYPTVHLEALACGTPVVTFRTGGAPEMLDDTCGMTVPVNDAEALLAAALQVSDLHRTASPGAPFTANACLAASRDFDANGRFADYIALYRELCRP